MEERGEGRRRERKEAQRSGGIKEEGERGE